MRRPAMMTTLLLLTFAGCGGESERSFADIEPCLTESATAAGFEASTAPDDLDIIAADAGDGAIDLSDDKQSITVIVERTASDAENTANLLASAAEAFGVNADDLVYRNGNVVASHDKSPTDDERALVEECL